ncbi:uncharacterized protein CTHT_0066660 [Thermochaetoides thermophila DSM 1495]|uniref:LCCL domain-containing protein n=1 Tax=Chaetomium thermophilum (strain DSM 1495 / CBS 144.50 / IMI 039719) TaxID=759272 RepID=G0SGK5_CHATD|nr:hypothetical protein CTHT_0066660 [Thermochaetoides thermophila DSM 1495]EGS17344.1 hypothetical protein CTHT_0066660 [Thermochaetoides thermophila DSM 1495]
MGETSPTPASRAQSSRAQDSTDITDSDATVVGPNHPDAPIRDASRLEDLEADSSPPTPRFIQDEGSWKRFKWVPYPVRRAIKYVARWARGPPNPVFIRIDPFFPRIQHLPIVLVDKYLPRKRQRVWAVLGYLSVWIITFALVMRHGLTISEIPGWSVPSAIGCGATFWADGNECGLDGIDCRPFNNGGYAFSCPASCSKRMLLNPHAVGDQEIVYQPLVVGGPPANGSGPAIYRADSFLCAAAIHAGVISDRYGGCGVAKLVGFQPNFTASTRNGISSVGFDSYFPRSFSFEEDLQCEVRDFRWNILAVSVVFSTIFSLFVSSAWLFFFPVFTILFWSVGMALDPPAHADTATLFSIEIGRYLPSMFVAWVMYDKMGIKRTLHGLTAQIEKTVFWLGAAWVGALTNYTLDFIPIQRLTGHDLNQQPGARAALAIIVIILAVIAASQIFFFRQEARLIPMLKLYILFGIGLLILGVLPDLNLRIHHYILALLLLPGTSLQMRPSLLYQGLLVGLFINGVARWDFDPIVQTSYELRGDAPMGSPLPVIHDPIIIWGGINNRSITFTWDPPPDPAYDGISVLVNDVERFRAYFDDEPGTAGMGSQKNVGTHNVTWVRQPGVEANEYFRFAWMQGSMRGDYTKAGKWDTEGKWTKMEPGPSKVKKRGGVDYKVL